MDFFENFKPIRNKLKYFSLWDILENLYRIQKLSKKQLTPEEVEFIYLNSLVYSNDYDKRINWDKREWVKLLNQCKALNNKISEPLLSPDSDPFDWLRTMGLNQAKAHSNSYSNQLYRYYYIFSSNAQIREYIENKINMSYNDFFIYATCLHMIYQNENYFFDRKYLLSIDKGAPFSSENIMKTLGILSITLSDLKVSLKKELRYDENSFNTNGLAGSEILAFTHLVKPIFEFNNKFYCLFPELLLHQFTSGIYYIAELYDPKCNLSNPFGSAFEDYVGLILEKNNVLKNLRILKEFPYQDGRNKNKTSDWTIETDDAIVFIECKTKRLRKESKMYENNEMEDENTIKESDTTIIAEAVEQVYKVYTHYSNNEIPGLFFDPSKVFIPIVLTLEEWFAQFPNINDKVTEIVKSKLKGEDIALVDRYKFHIFSISKFESVVQIMFKHGFKYYFKELDSNKIINQIEHRFDYKNYFEDEINCILTESIKDISKT